jgi:2-oxoisovalerate dehydrogenase E1 component
MSPDPAAGPLSHSVAEPREGADAEFSREAVLRDYRTAYQSRQASLLGRREVLTGKAKFGIFGAGKEVPQLAMARAFRAGDFRSGYYRDQTFMLATGMTTLEEYFAQLYAHPEVEADPASAGRQMNAHFATRTLHPDGSWRDLADSYNSAADLSPTGSQMPKLVGLAYASCLYRRLPELAGMTRFSRGGDEIAFGTIGDASCAEGLFWESVNAIGVLGAPALLSIWDDGYGISVPNELQITKSSLSAVLAGFQREPGGKEGFEIFTVPGWDYPALCEAYLAAADIVRREHVPVLMHVTELTQPQGHSTSGSHERYKSPERLAWEAEHDCLRKMRQWILAGGLADAEELERCEQEDRERVTEVKLKAWKAFRRDVDDELKILVALAGDLARVSAEREEIEAASAALLRRQNPLRRDVLAAAEEILVAARGDAGVERERLVEWKSAQVRANRRRYGSDVYSETADSPLEVPVVPPVYDPDAPELRGFEILNACFDAALGRDPRVIAFGQDVGQLGDVNQGFAGLQEKYGVLRVTDTGIREATIIGQAIGMAMRGLRPIAEIQYLDYLLYCLQILADDLATLRWRTRGGQKAPVIVRTRGHRLEGVWHAGSPLGALVDLLRGMVVCVPRDMTRAAGLYNTLLQGDDPALVVEVLNGYRLREKLPRNIGELTVPLGVPEVIRAGADVTVVTYGACCRIVLEAADLLAKVGVDAEVIDVQTLLPFDRFGHIGESLKKTNRIVFVDEDVPGGASAYMLQQVIEGQQGYYWLDSEPRTVSAPPHRPAYGSDGDYFSKPNREEVFEAVYELMHEADPKRFPLFYR